MPRTIEMPITRKYQGSIWLTSMNDVDARRRGRLSFDLEATDRKVARSRADRRQRYAGYTARSAEPFLELDEIGATRRSGRRVAKGFWDGAVDLIQVRRVEPKIRVLHVDDAAHEHRRADDERRRQRHLADDEQARIRARSLGARPTAPVFSDSFVACRPDCSVPMRPNTNPLATVTASADTERRSVETRNRKLVERTPGAQRRST